MIGHLVYAICNSCLDPCGGMDGMRDDVKQARQAAWENGWEQRTGADGEVIDLCRTCKVRPFRPAAVKFIDVDKGASTVIPDPHSPTGFREATP